MVCALKKIRFSKKNLSCAAGCTGDLKKLCAGLKKKPKEAENFSRTSIKTFVPMHRIRVTTKTVERLLNGEKSSIFAEKNCYGLLYPNL